MSWPVRESAPHQITKQLPEDHPLLRALLQPRRGGPGRAAEVHDDPGSVSMGLQGPLSQAEFQWITNTYKCIICGKGLTAAMQFCEIVQERLYLACFPPWA